MALVGTVVVPATEVQTADVWDGPISDEPVVAHPPPDVLQNECRQALIRQQTMARRRSIWAGVREQRGPWRREHIGAPIPDMFENASQSG